MRFSKQSVAGAIDGQLESLARELFEETGRSYDLTTGHEQVSGKGEAANRLYAEINVLEELITRLDIDCQSRVWEILTGKTPTFINEAEAA